MTQHFLSSRGRPSMPSAAGGLLLLALCLPAGPARALQVTTFNTGTATPVPGSALLAPGALDPHYVRVQFPASGGGPLLGAAEVANFLPSTWLPAGGTSGWIKPGFNNDGTAPAMFGSHFYETSFDLSGMNPATALFNGRWATDNPTGRIYLNGVDLMAAGGLYNVSFPGGWSSFSFTGASAQSTLVSGVNHLQFEVKVAPHPAAAWAGLRVEYAGEALPVPEPGAWALMVAGLAGLALARWRRSQPGACGM